MSPYTPPDAITFDIETTGLSAEDEVISIALYEHGEHDPRDDAISQNSHVSEKLLLQALCVSIKAMSKDVILVTFNGQNFKSGFDFPMLRTRMHKHGVPWPFKGMNHIDLYPIVEKRWNTAVMPEPTLKRLTKKDQMIQVAAELRIHLEAKDTLKAMSEDIISECTESDIIQAIITTQDLKPIATNTLKGAYQVLTGKDPGDMDGKQAVKLWTQYKETGDVTCLERIREYNIEDCRKTLELYEICEAYCSRADMRPEVL